MKNTINSVVIDCTKPMTCQEVVEKTNIDCPKETGVYKAEFKADDYPNGVAKVRELTSGDVLYIHDTTNIVKIGDKFKDYPAIVSGIYYEPKKWWQFWKRKKQIGYCVEWL